MSYLFIHDLNNPPRDLADFNYSRFVKEYFLSQAALTNLSESLQLISPQVPSGPAPEVARGDYYESGGTLKL